MITVHPVRFLLKFSTFVVALSVCSLHAADKTVIPIAGPRIHGSRAHEHNAGMLLLQECLAGDTGLKNEVALGGWPKDALSALSVVEAVIIYAIGGPTHVALQNDNL